MRRDGLDFAQGARLGAFQHHGNRALPRGFGDGSMLSLPSEDFPEAAFVGTLVFKRQPYR